MKPETARTLLVLSAICIAVGASASSPSLTLLLAVISAAAATAPVILAPRRPRLWGMALLGLSLVLAYTSYDDFMAEQKTYRERARARGTQPPPIPDTSAKPAAKGDAR